MKLSEGYKRQLNSISVILCLVIFSIPIFFSHAQTAQDLRDKINQKGSDIASLEREISSYQSQLDALGKQKDSLSGSLKELDLNKKTLDASISLTQKKIDKTNLKISGLSSDIGNKEESISNSVASIALGLKQTSEFEQDTFLGVVLSKNNFTDVWNDIDGMVSVRDKIRSNIITLKQVKGELEDTRQVTIDAKKELTVLQSQLVDQKKIVVQNVNEKASLLKQTQNNEANYQTLLKDRVAKRDAFEKQIQDYEAQLQYVLDPSKLPKGRVLSWPLKEIFVTQQFGVTVDSKRLYSSGSHSGVDFRASIGTPVMSMADGKVLGVGDTDLVCRGASFGKFVFIQYNNGLSSAYGHLSLIKARVGDTVQRGEVVAYSGNTGHTTGPHLHVSLYIADAVKMTTELKSVCGPPFTMPLAPMNAYLNALDYLPPLLY